MTGPELPGDLSLETRARDSRRDRVRPVRRFLIPLVGWALSLSTARSLGVDLDWWGLLACVAGVHAAYRFDNLSDSLGFPAMLQHRRARALIADAALMAVALLASPRLLLPLVLLSLAGLLYVPLKRVIPKNLLTAAAWTVTVFGLSLHGLEMTADAWLTASALFFTVLSNAVLCDLPDLERDRANGVLGFGARVSPLATARIAGTFGLLGLALALAGYGTPLCVPAASYAFVGWVLPQWVREDRTKRVWLDAVMVTPGPISLPLTLG